MKKEITVLVIVALLITGAVYAQSLNSDDGGNVSIDDNIMAAIDSIQNKDTKGKVLDLMSSIAYSIESCSDSDERTVESESNSYLESIEKMAYLTGDDLEKEIAKVVEKTVTENIGNSNIQWNKDFVERYVKEYCPQYYDRLAGLIEDESSDSAGGG